MGKYFQISKAFFFFAILAIFTSNLFIPYPFLDILVETVHVCFLFTVGFFFFPATFMNALILQCCCSTVTPLFPPGTSRSNLVWKSDHNNRLPLWIQVSAATDIELFVVLLHPCCIPREFLHTILVGCLHSHCLPTTQPPGVFS